MIDIVFSKKFLISTVCIAIVYTIIVIYMMNFSLVKDAFTGGYSFTYIFSLLFALLKGMWTAMSGMGLLLLLLVSLLTGANLTLLWEKVKTLHKFERLHLVVGGNSLLGIVGSGCAACGLPILSLLGLSGSLMYLPFHGAELSYLSVILLSVSLYLLMQSAVDVKRCALPVKERRVI